MVVLTLVLLAVGLGPLFGAAEPAETGANRSLLEYQEPVARSGTLSRSAAGPLAAVGQRAPGQPTPGQATKVRGITVSTHRGGREWGDRAVMAPTFREVAGVGANWVSIHPYAGISADGSVSQRGSEDFSWLQEPIREAHAQGLQILIKPHLAYWGSPFSWRGEITFNDDAAWNRFFDSYQSWITAVAKATVGADAFAVGTELDKTLDHESEWRTVIEAVRKHNGAALTYAANWTDFERVPFWDQLDAIGIQAYFPISAEERPREEVLRAAWSDRMAQLADYSKRTQRPVVFTELGYSRTWLAAREPWLAQTDEEDAEVLQRLCLRIALEAIEAEPTVVGSFLWKWFPEPRAVGRDFQMAAPGVRTEIRSAWLNPKRSGV